MYGIFSYIYHKNQPNVDEYTSPMDPSWVEMFQNNFVVYFVMSFFWLSDFPSFSIHFPNRAAKKTTWSCHRSQFASSFGWAKSRSNTLRCEAQKNHVMIEYDEYSIIFKSTPVLLMPMHESTNLLFILYLLGTWDTV